ncbi:nuclear pore complex protein NUP98B-like [Raphanus sativus]|uniref:Nuclear pore complex protein NUP98B n=1 Tax=Raphanus sativus TaxID=3726 RepID=A0A6J0LCP2_RAPSA|nr:nuclear pore complex protein NUP98B [Raphanus sativus]KAJ4877120.1 nuclear pore complex protein NUP98B-like [Raphanus sativus]
MRIDVSEPELCGCDTCVQHRTFITQETEPSKEVIGSSVPVSSEPVQPLGSTSDQSSGTETTPLAPPPVTTPVNNPEPAAQSVGSTIPPAVTPVSSEQPAQALGSTSDQSSGTETTPLAPPITTSVKSVDSTIFFKFPPVQAQALAPTASGSTQAPAFGFGAFAARVPSATSGCSAFSFAPPVTSAPVQAPGTTTTTTTTSAAAAPASPFHSSSPTTFQFPPAFTSLAASTFPSVASSTSSPLDAPPSPFRWGSLQANTSPPFSFLPAQGSDKTGSAFTPPFGYPGGFARPDVGVSHPGFGPSNHFGPNAPTTTPVPVRSPFLAGGGTEQGSRYPRYSPTPDVDGRLIMSISASNSHGHKSHEELRWEDYKNGDKGGFGWFPPVHTSPFSSPTVSPSLFAPPSIPNRPQMRTIDLTNRDMCGFPIGYNTPAAFQRPPEPAGVSSPGSGCTACGATSRSSPSSHLGLNNTTNPPSAATSLPGMFFSTYGSCPLLFGSPNLAAYGTTAIPAVQAYAIMFGTPNFTSQGTTATPAFQAYPIMFGTPNLAAQGTTRAPAVQAYPMMFGTPNIGAQGSTPAAQTYPLMFGTPNLAAQGTTNIGARGATPAAQAYPLMFGTPNLAAQGTTTPAAQPYPTMFGTPNLAGQSTTTTPAGQPYPTTFAVPQAATAPAVQPYAMMFGTPSLGAQDITPGGQAYPAHGLTLPFAAMSLQ